MVISISPAKHIAIKVFSIILPGILYIGWFIYTWIDVSTRTSRSGYTEDYTALGLIFVPFIAVVHYAVSGVLALMAWGVTRLLKKHRSGLSIMSVSMYVPFVVIAFIAFINLFF